MDMETIKRINRDALRAAQEAEAGAVSLVSSKHAPGYILAVVMSIVAYFALRQYQPDFVKSSQNGALVYDDKRSIGFAVLLGVLILIANYLINQ